jgi:hypothetical protein
MKENLTHLRDSLFRAASQANDVADTAARMGDTERFREYRNIAYRLYDEAEGLNRDCDKFGVVRE